MGVRTVRMNVRVSPECREWIQREAQRMDVPQGAVIEWAVQHYRSQMEILQVLPKLVELADRLEKASTSDGAAEGRVKAERSEP